MKAYLAVLKPVLSLLFTVSMLAWPSAWAKSDDSSTSDFGDLKKMSPDFFRSQFRVKGEVFVTDKTGRQLANVLPVELVLAPGEKSSEIHHSWNFTSNVSSPIHLVQDWTISDDGSAKVKLVQRESADAKSKVIREESIDVENFAPLSWVAEKSDSRRVIVRLTPFIHSFREVGNLSEIPIGGDRGNFIITDNQGFLWGESVRFGGVLAGMKSHRGSFIISFYPFKGASELGTVSGSEIQLRLSDTLRLKIHSDNAIMPGELKFKVYGIYLPKLKSNKPQSVFSFGQNNWDGVPDEFKKAL